MGLRGGKWREGLQGGSDDGVSCHVQYLLREDISFARDGNEAAG